MYRFVDVNETSEGLALPSEALRINGKYIEKEIKGYRTISVSGREALSAELVTYETDFGDGAILKGKKYPPRVITVRYQLVAKDAEYFRRAYNRLGGILNVTEAQIVFADEEDRFYIGTPTEIEEVDSGKNNVIGEFKIVCADPFKYSLAEYEAIPNYADGSILLDYQGTYKSYPTLEAHFYEESDTRSSVTGKGECGFVAFMNEHEKIIQMGNPEEVDTEEKYTKSQTLINSLFDKVDSYDASVQSQWRQNAGITAGNVEKTGSIGMLAASYEKPTVTNTDGTLLNEVATTGGAPIFYYTVKARTANRTANSVDVTVTVTTRLRYAGNYFGSPYSLGGHIYMGGTWHPITIKTPSEYWQGQSGHSASITFKVSGLSTTQTEITGIKFKVARTDSMGPFETGKLNETACYNLKISNYVSDTPSSYCLGARTYGSSSGRHGASIARNVPADQSGVTGADHCVLTFSNLFSIGNGKNDMTQVGFFQALLVGNGKVLAGVSIEKDTSGSKANICHYVNGRKQTSKEVDASFGNKYFKVGVSSTISKNGAIVSFNIGGIGDVIEDPAIKDAKVTEVVFVFGQYGLNPALGKNSLFSAKFVKNNCDTILDVPNRFSANDVVKADCNTGKIYLNGVLDESLGALGNDWEDFYLVPGLNQIGFAYSEWVSHGYEPRAKIKYREVFL